ncbi:MAG TPA: ABC transporter substrate-binding protein [Baekduia sp.]|uniref:ABC transporter substrate-binding protein n=1 Tax=Baekduia sp. TaxID=2600305 RepID=UPI002D77E226|nr:ABC transporter substrate-binding protein [Baekduia sp.]HET6507355.1 ABC transporter substrate-binding protein [Baekduia sp.]
MTPQYEPMSIVPGEVVLPSAQVDEAGRIREVNDGRGRRLLDAYPALVEYARALLALELGSARFVWADEEATPTAWYAVHVQRLPRPVDQPATALVELVAIEAPYGLTLRELDVLTLVAGGLNNPEVGAHLRTSPRTVSKHVEHILEKLGQATRAGVASIAIQHGILRLPVPGGGRSVDGLVVGALDQHVRRGFDVPSRHRKPPPLPRSRPRPYLIGSAFPLGGPSRGEGLEMTNASRMAIAEINARGGIAGRPIEQVVVDVEITEAGGPTAALQRLIDLEVDAITAGYDFEEGTATYERIGAYGCPVLNTMTSEVVAQMVSHEPDRFGNVFQAVPTEIHYGSGFVRTLDELERRGWTPRNRRVVLIETAIQGGRASSPETLDAAERSGWTVDAIVTVPTYEVDWASALAQIRATEPAAVLLLHFVPLEAARFQLEFLAEPTDTLIYGVYAPSAAEYLPLVGDAAEGMLWATVSGSYDDRFGRAFATQYADTYGSPPGRSVAGLSYDQVHLLTQAWARVGNPRAFDDVARELRRIVHRGVNGSYFLGHERQCALAYPDETPDPTLGQAQLVFQIQDGRQRILAPRPYADAQFRVPPWFGAREARSDR